MLAEPTLQGFAERIADDLPDDLAVLRDLQIPGFNPGSKPEPMGALGLVEGIDGAGLGGAEPGIGSQATNIKEVERVSNAYAHFLQNVIG